MSVLEALNKPISFKLRMPRLPERRVAPASTVMPRVDLLPPSVLADRRLRRAVRITGVAAATVIVVVIAAVGGSWWYADTAAKQLATENDRTAALLESQTEFAQVSQALSSVDRLDAARAIAGSFDVEWAPYLASISALLPPDAVVKGVTMTAIVPGAPNATTTDAVEADAAATLLYTVQTGDLASVEQWILALPNITGYQKASLQSVSEEGGRYSAVVQIVVSDAILSGRFTPAETAAATGTPAATTADADKGN